MHFFLYFPFVCHFNASIHFRDLIIFVCTMGCCNFSIPLSVYRIVLVYRSFRRVFYFHLSHWSFSRDLSCTQVVSIVSGNCEKNFSQLSLDCSVQQSEVYLCDIVVAYEIACNHMNWMQLEMLNHKAHLDLREAVNRRTRQQGNQLTKYD